LSLAEKYSEGVTLLAQGDLEGATTALEWVLEQEPGYAGGNAAALLGRAPEIVDEATPVAGGEVTELVPPQVRVEEEYDGLMQSGDAAMAAGDYSEAEGHYRQASVIAAPWLLSSYVRLAAAHVGRGEYKLAVDAMQAAFLVLTRSAIAIPYSSYAGYVEQGDRYAEDEDYQSALSEYAEALGVVEQTCHCGLEDWSILP
jgi:tetratricopeptide (TPR) repeat protein